MSTHDSDSNEVAKPDHTAVSMWVEVDEDGEAALCWDQEDGETKAVGLSRSAAGDLRHELEHGPTVRRDLDQ